MISYFIEHKPVRIFVIDPYITTFYFAEKNGEVKALMFDGDGQLKVLDKEEFVECCWDDYFPKVILDNYY